jgi:DnaJ-class molecular chaperone
MSETLYSTLGVKENASSSDIKKAYRSLSLKYHPDKNTDPDAQPIFQKINGAYEVLGDEDKRKRYDSQRKNPFMRMASMNQEFSGGDEFNDIEDFLQEMFGGGERGMGMAFGLGPFGLGSNPFTMDPNPFTMGSNPFTMGPNPFVQRQGQRQGSNALEKPTPIVKTLQITIKQIYVGTTLPIEIERWIHENGTKVFEKETLYVVIPQGVDDNEMIVLRDKGNVLNENLKGDVKLFVKIANDSEFKRHGLDLHYEKTITLKEALCGFSFQLRFLDGKTYTLNNIRGNIITPEYNKIIPNMGLKRESHKGNLVIIFHVQFPETLAEEEMSKIENIL